MDKPCCPRPDCLSTDLIGEGEVTKNNFKRGREQWVRGRHRSWIRCKTCGLKLLYKTERYETRIG